MMVRVAEVPFPGIRHVRVMRRRIRPAFTTAVGIAMTMSRRMLPTSSARSSGVRRLRNPNISCSFRLAGVLLRPCFFLFGRLVERSVIGLGRVPSNATPRALGTVRGGFDGFRDADMIQGLGRPAKRKTIGRRRACVPFRRTRGPGLPVPGPRVSRRSGNIGFPAVREVREGGGGYVPSGPPTRDAGCRMARVDPAVIRHRGGSGRLGAGGGRIACHSAFVQSGWMPARMALATMMAREHFPSQARARTAMGRARSSPSHHRMYATVA